MIRSTKKKADGIRIRSKCDWQDHDEKFLKYFLDLEKSRADQNQNRNIFIGNIEVHNQKDISNEIYLYYKNLLVRDKTYQNLT